MNETENIIVACDRRTLAFYGTLLGLLILDIVFLLVVFNPFTRLSVTTNQAPPPPRIVRSAVVAAPAVPKPSPFTLTAQKSSFKAKRKPRPLTAFVEAVQ